MSNVLSQWRAGFVRRWHMSPDMSHIDDCNHGHQGRCGVLVLSLWPDCAKDFLAAAVTHDLREVVTGDIAGPSKVNHPDALRKIEEIGDEWEDHCGFAFNLTRDEMACLHFVDKLDAYLFVKHRAPHLLSGEGWPDARERLLKMAKELGVWHAVAWL